MMLHYEEYGNGVPLVILHGLLGSSANWRVIAKELSRTCRVISVDLPNHGKSPHVAEADLEMTCDCVIETMCAAGVDKAYILGHSMGGKIGMQLAADYPEHMLGLIVADMLPKAVPPVHLFVLRACQQLDLSAATRRSDLDQQLSHAIPQFEVRAFILKNVRRDEHNRFYWQLNLPNIIANYTIVSDAPKLLMPYEGRTLFLGGEESPYKIESEETLIHRWFPNAQIQTIKNAGHLLHVDQSQKFSALVRKFIT